MSKIKGQHGRTLGCLVDGSTASQGLSSSLLLSIFSSGRIIILALGHCIITCIEDCHSTSEARLGEILHLPQITFEDQLHNRHTLQRLQFPIAPASAPARNGKL